MPIPDGEAAMLPLLQFTADGAEHRFRDATEEPAFRFELNDEERVEMLPGGTTLLSDNRLGWARTYLKQTGLLGFTKRS